MKLFASLILLLSVNLHGQTSKVVAGQIECEQGNFRKAYSELSTALKDTAALNEKHLAMAYFYRAKARVGFAVDIAESIVKGNSVSDSEMKLAESYVIDSWSDYQKTLSYKNVIYDKKVKSELEQFTQHANKAALDKLNLTYANTMTDIGKKTTLEEGIKNSEIAIGCNPNYYLSYDIQGQLFQGLKKYEDAMKSYQKSVELFKTNPPQYPDQLIAYVYYRMASLERYYLYETSDLEKCLGLIRKGKAVLEKEFEREQGHKKSMTVQAWDQTLAQYRTALQDLGTTELDILLNIPERITEAIAAFENILEKNPNDYLKLLALATLYEQTDAEKAVETYLKATVVDPSKSHAWFNLGALYFNKGAELNKQSNDAPDVEVADALLNKADVWYKKALEPLQKAEELDDCNKHALNALKQVTLNLSNGDAEMIELHAKYKAKFESCFKNFEE